jgi:cytochrome c5
VHAPKEQLAMIRWVLLGSLLVAGSALGSDSPKPGEKTVAEICSMCHAPGLMGAPKIGDGAAWGARLKDAGSIDGLVESAEHGKRSMPPRGGHPELTEDDLKAAIQFMLSKSGLAGAP